jgi:hypothetical protein
VELKACDFPLEKGIYGKGSTAKKGEIKGGF